MAAIDGKQIVNMLYHAGVARKLLKRTPPKVDFNMGDVAMLSLEILSGMATRDMLIKQGIILADIMK